MRPVSCTINHYIGNPAESYIVIPYRYYCRCRRHRRDIKSRDQRASDRVRHISLLL